MVTGNKKIFNVETESEESLNTAVEMYMNGKIFIYPTDTIYGIGGNPFNHNVVQRINSIKKRDISKQFVLLVSGIEILLNFVELNSDDHIEYLKRIWPAPVTVVFNLNERARQNLSYITAAFRIPDNDFCIKLLNEIKLPLISTSVNRSSQKPLNENTIIIKEFADDIDAVFISEKTKDSYPSTIIALTSERPELIREGEIKFVDLLGKFI